MGVPVVPKGLKETYETLGEIWVFNLFYLLD